MLNLKNYKFVGSLMVDEDTMLGDFLSNYEGSAEYFCDAISATADSMVPIYTYDVWKDAAEIQEFIEEAVEEGIAPIEGSVDLVKIFQAGYYLYFNQSLHENLETMAFNYVVWEINSYLDDLEDTQVELLDLDQLERDIEDAVERIDSNSRILELDEIVEEIKEEIEAETGAEEE